MANLALVLLVVWLALVAACVATSCIGEAWRLADRLQGSAGLGAVVGAPDLHARDRFRLAAPVAELAGLAPIAFLDHAVLRWAGVVLVVFGIAGTLAAQWALGDAWRGDVDPAAEAGALMTVARSGSSATRSSPQPPRPPSAWRSSCRTSSRWPCSSRSCWRWRSRFGSSKSPTCCGARRRLSNVCGANRPLPCPGSDVFEANAEPGEHRGGTKSEGAMTEGSGTEISSDSR